MTSKHWTEDRQERENLIKTIGLGTEVATFMVDKGHRNGPELHTITTTGIIIVRNARTKKMVTKLIARPNQIRRYFDEITEEVERVITVARKHQQKGYNMVQRKKETQISLFSLL